MARTLLGTFACSLLLACGSAEETQQPLETLQGPFATFENTGDGELTALLEGTLQLENNCLYVTPNHGGERFLPVFPSDTTWDADRSVVVTSDGVEAPLDSLLGFSGGESRRDSRQLPAGCDSSVTRWIVFRVVP